MSRAASIICGVCQCTLDSGDCVHVYGTGTTDDPYRFEPIINDAPGNIIECGPNGMGAFLLPIYIDPPAVHMYATIEQTIAYDTVQALQFNEQRYNTDNMRDEDDLGIIRFNTPGLYLVTFNARWKKTNDSTATGDMAAFLMRNGAQYLVIDSYPVPGPDSFAKHSISMLYPFEAGDFCSALLKQDVVNEDDEPFNLTATVERMSPIFCAMYMRPLEGMDILGVPASSPTLSESGSGIGTQYALGGTQWWQTDDHASLDITGDIDMRAAVAPADWTPVGDQYFLAKEEAGVGTQAYGLVLLTSGLIRCIWSPDGTTGLFMDSTVGIGAANGSLLLVRATLDVNNGAAGRDSTFYTKASTPALAATDLESNSGWTQLGTTVTTATATSILANAKLLVGGSRNNAGSNNLIGDLYALIVKNGINGTTVANPNFYANNSPFTDGSGRTWIKLP